MQLSDIAMQVILRTGMQRNMHKTCSEPELRGRLQDRGLPAYDAALEFERSFGGMLWDGILWGTFAALTEAKRDSITLEALGDYHGAPLLPVGTTFSGDAFYDGTVQFMLSREGWIVIEHNGPFPVAESATCFFERKALRQRIDDRPTAVLRWRVIPTGTAEDFRFFVAVDPEIPDDYWEEAEPYYLEDPERALDEQVAEAAGMPLYAPASDRCVHVWYDRRTLLYPYWLWGSDYRFVRGETIDDIVRMLRAAALVRPTVAAWWRGPAGEAPQPGEEVVLELASIDERENWRGHLLVVGKRGQYRVHERLFENPLSLARLWEARREEWEAMEKRRLTR